MDLKYSLLGRLCFALSKTCKQNMNVFALDVECVATGQRSNDRAVAHIAVVDINENVVFNRFVQPSAKIRSYLTPLTGLVPGSLVGAPPLHDVLQELRGIFAENSILVGQNITKDIEWLGLEKSMDFLTYVDTGKMFGYTRRNGSVRYFSLRHLVRYLGGFEGAGTDIQVNEHCPVTDAVSALRIYKTYHSSTAQELERLAKKLSKCPPTIPFWKTCPYIDGVQVGPAHEYRGR